MVIRLVLVLLMQILFSSAFPLWVKPRAVNLSALKATPSMMQGAAPAAQTNAAPPMSTAALGEASRAKDKYVAVAGEDVEHFKQMSKLADQIEKDSYNDPKYGSAFTGKRPNGSKPNFTNIYLQAQKEGTVIEKNSQRLDLHYMQKIHDLRKESKDLDEQSMQAHVSFDEQKDKIAEEAEAQENMAKEQNEEGTNAQLVTVNTENPTQPSHHVPSRL